MFNEILDITNNLKIKLPNFCALVKLFTVCERVNYNIYSSCSVLICTNINKTNIEI